MEIQLEQEIIHYWTNRAAGYSKVNQEELQGSQKRQWFCELQGQIERSYPGHQPQDITVLDIGTGPGFFAIILAEAGYRVTAIDSTSEMLKEAKQNAGPLAGQIRLIQMDAQRLTFADQIFDVVISRNLTWVLPDPLAAYASWLNVLKPGGLLLNYDANWYGYLYDEEKRLLYEQDREAVTEHQLEDHYIGTDIDSMERIAMQVPSSAKLRPAWDLGVLQRLPVRQVETDPEVWRRVWSDTEKVNYKSTPMFRIMVRKE